MSDDSTVTSETDYAAIELISGYLSDAIVSISRHHPEWLSDKFSYVRWMNPNLKSKLTDWLQAKLTRYSDAVSLTRQIMKIWEYFTVPSFLLTVEFARIMTDIGRILYREERISFQKSAASWAESGAIAVLLLDAENTNLTPNAEKVLAAVCTYPLQVKIAFANWRYAGMANKEAELHARGYQLLHAPEAKNGADAQMIAMGASIKHYYPHTKEVFVCSADALLIHLCNSLQNQGLTVYRVRRNKDTIEIHNRYNGDIRYYSIINNNRNVFAELVKLLEEIMKELESESVEEQLIQLSDLVARFHKQAAVSANANDFDLASTLAEQPQIISAETEDVKGMESRLSVLSVNSLKMLDDFLIDCVRVMTYGGALEYISAVQIIKYIRAQYDKDINLIVKKIQPNCSLIKYLRSRPSVFDIKLVGKEHRVALTKGEPEIDLPLETTDSLENGVYEITLPDDITSQTQLEQAVFKIVENYTAKSPGSYVLISNVGTVFHKQYGQPINKVIQGLQIGSKFLKFLQDCKSLQVKKDEKTYKVAIR